VWFKLLLPIIQQIQPIHKGDEWLTLVVYMMRKRMILKKKRRKKKKKRECELSYFKKKSAETLQL